MVFDKVKELISEQLDVKADDITEASNIQDDLGADSLDVVDLVMALEDEFDVEIPEDQVENIKTVGDIVKFIEDKQQFIAQIFPLYQGQLCTAGFLYLFRCFAQLRIWIPSIHSIDRMPTSFFIVKFLTDNEKWYII